MSLKLNFGLTQKITMSHKMQQALSVLSLSHEELQQAIQNELLENPLLEAVDPFHSEKTNEGILNFRMYDYLESDFRKSQSFCEDFTNDFANNQTLSFKDSILKQVEEAFFSKKVKTILPFLISCLDERGYLNLDIKDLSKKENIPLNLLEKSLKALQSLEPLGVGSRNLQECLLIQLRHKNKETKTIRLIVQNHLENIKEKKYKAIAYDLDISLEKTLQFCKLILSLNPHPAQNFSTQPTVFVRADFYIYKHHKDYHVVFNTENIPVLKFSKQYAQSIRKMGNLKAKEKKYLTEKSYSALWFIRAIQQRQKKIKQIAYYLVEHQKEFFEKGFSYLQPLKMKNLAKTLGVHASTISRAIHNKYVYTPQGILSLKSFFQKGLVTKEGDFISI